MPVIKTAMGVSANGTAENGTGIVNCAAAAVSATPNATEATRSAPLNGDTRAAWSSNEPWRTVPRIAVEDM